MDKYTVIRCLKANIEQIPYGQYVTVEQIFGEEWQLLPPSTRRQSSKEFKIGVATRAIRGVYFSHQRSDKAWLYKRVVADDN